MRFLFFVILFLLSVQNNLPGQRNLLTLSGQKVYVSTDESWLYYSSYLEQKKTFLDKYFKDLDHCDSGQKDLIREMIRRAEEKEIELAIQCDRLDYIIARKEVSYFEAERSKNKETIQRLKTELKQEKSLLSRLLEEYEKESQILREIWALPSLPNENLMIFIHEKAVIYGLKNEYPQEGKNEETVHTYVNTIPDDESVMTKNDIDDSVGVKKADKRERAVEKGTTSGTSVENKDQYIDLVSVQKKKNKKEKTSDNPFELSFQRPECQMLTGDDIVPGKSGTRHQRLLSYAPGRASQYFRDTYLMDILAGMVRNKRHYSINFKIEMVSRDAAKNYGIIESGALIKLVGINGVHINMSTQASSSVKIESFSGKVIFEFSCILSRGQVKTLAEFPLDFMGIMWTSGFETYPIYEVDMIMHHISCLKKSSE